MAGCEFTNGAAARSVMQLLNSTVRRGVVVGARRLRVLFIPSLMLLWVVLCYLFQSRNVIGGVGKGLGLHQGPVEGWLWRTGVVSLFLGLVARLFSRGAGVKKLKQPSEGKGMTWMWMEELPRKRGVKMVENEMKGIGNEDGRLQRIGAHFGNSEGWDSCGKPLIKNAHLTKESTSAPKGVLRGNHETISDKWLLAPRSLSSRDKPLTVVLDLDDTLIMAKKSQEIPGKVAHAIKMGHLSAMSSKFSHGNLEMDLSVILRPGVKKFLEKVSSFAEIVVFTAGSAAYADPLISFLDPNGTLLSGRLFRCSTVKTRYQEYVKDLSLLGRCLKKTVLLDDKPFSGLLQPYNVIPCAPFMGDPRDHQLLASYLPLLEHLSHAYDVRPVLKDVFQMHSYMVEWGVREEYLQKCLDNPGDTQHFRL